MLCSVLLIAAMSLPLLKPAPAPFQNQREMIPKGRLSFTVAYLSTWHCIILLQFVDFTGTISVLVMVSVMQSF